MTWVAWLIAAQCASAAAWRAASVSRWFDMIEV
jgi:hypothetical protein